MKNVAGIETITPRDIELPDGVPSHLEVTDSGKTISMIRRANSIHTKFKKTCFYWIYDIVAPLAPLWDIISDIIFTFSVFKRNIIVFAICFALLYLSARHVVFFYYAHITQQHFFAETFRRYFGLNCVKILPKFNITLKASWGTVILMYVPFYDYFAFHKSEPRYTILFSLFLNIIVLIFGIPLYLTICIWQSYKAIKNNLRRESHRGSFAFFKFLESFESLPQFGIQCWAFMNGLVDDYIFYISAAFSWIAIVSALFIFYRYRTILRTGFDAKQMNSQEIFNRHWTQDKWSKALENKKNDIDDEININLPHWGKKKTCLYYFCEQNGPVQFLKQLLDYGADISWKFIGEDLESEKEIDLSCLDVACIKGHVKIVHGLLAHLSLKQKTLNYNLPDLIKRACFYAIENGRVEIMQLFVDTISSDLAKDYQMYNKAIEHDQVEIMEIYLAAKMLNPEEISRGLQSAVLHRSMLALERLLLENILTKWYDKALTSAKLHQREKDAGDERMLDMLRSYPRNYKLQKIMKKLETFNEKDLSKVLDIIDSKFTENVDFDVKRDPDENIVPIE